MGKAFRKSPQILVVFVLFFVGFIFCLFASLFAISSFSYFRTAQPVEAVIADIAVTGDGDHSAIVTYTFQGTAYETTLSYYSSSMRTGDPITVYIQPDRPEEARVKSHLLPIIFGSVGLVLAGVAIGVLLHYRKRRKQIRAVLENGRHVLARVTGIDRNLHYSVNNRHPFVVTCIYQETPYARPVSFRSENLRDYPNLQLGDLVPVYYDPASPKIYYVQVDREQEKIEI